MIGDIHTGRSFGAAPPSAEVYERVLSTIDHNTGGPESPLPAGTTPACIAGILASAGIPPDAVERAIRAAADDDLLVWRDREGLLRLTPTDDQSLRHLIGAENQHEHPDVELIERCAELITDE